MYATSGLTAREAYRSFLVKWKKLCPPVARSLEEALAVARATGDRSGEAYIHYDAAGIDSAQGRYRQALEHAQEDVGERLLRDARVEAERIIAALKKAMDDDRDLLSAAETEALRAASNELGEAAKGSSYQLIRARTEKLDQLSVEFAARRMDRSINAALAGKTVGEVSRT